MGDGGGGSAWVLESNRRDITSGAGGLDRRCSARSTRRAVDEDDAHVGGIQNAAYGGPRQLRPGAEIGDDVVEPVGQEHAGDPASDCVRERGLRRRAAEQREPRFNVEDYRRPLQRKRAPSPLEPAVVEALEVRRYKSELLGQGRVGIAVDGERPRTALGERPGDERGDGGLADPALSGDRELQRRTAAADRRGTATNSS
jgi:hypothetical protein